MSSSIRIESSRNFVLICTFVLISFDCISKVKSLTSFFKKYYSDIVLLCRKISELKAIYNRYMAKRVLHQLKKIPGKFKIRDCIKSIDFLAINTTIIKCI